MDTSAAFNNFYGNFMAELGLAFPDDEGVERTRRAFSESVERDPSEPARRMGKEVEPAMEALMAFDGSAADGAAMDSVLATVRQRVGLLRDLGLPEGEGPSGPEGEALLKNKAAAIDYVRNLGLMAIGLAHMPPAMLSLIAGLAEDGDDSDPGDGGQAADMMSMLAPMLGPMLGKGLSGR